MNEKYFVAKITTDMVDNESGKVKKIPIKLPKRKI